MTRLMFDRFNSKTEEIRSAQPLGSTLGPEAWLTVKVNERRYRIHKRFLEEPLSEFYTEINGSWILKHTGDTADASSRMLLGGDAPARSAAKPENRGIAHALWYLQSDGAVPQDEWSEGVKRGIQGLIRIALRTEAEKIFLTNLDREYRKYWTPEGRRPVRSELSSIRSEIERMQKELSEFREAETRISGFRQDLENAVEQRDIKSGELKESQEELRSLSILLEEAEGYENRLKDQLNAAERMENRLNELRSDRDVVSRNQKEILRLDGEIRVLEESLHNRRAESRAAFEDAEGLSARVRNELEPALQAVERELKGLQSAGNLRRLEKDRKRLEDHVERLKNLREELELKKSELSILSAPTSKDIQRFEKLNSSLASLSAKIESSAVMVSFRWHGERKHITSSPPASSLNENEFIVKEATEFNVADIVTISIRSGAEELRDLLSKHDIARKEIDGILSIFGVRSSEELIRLFEKRRSVETTIESLKKRIEDLEQSEPDAANELSRIIKGIEEEKRSASFIDLKPEDNRGSTIREMIRLREERKKKLIAEISETQNDAAIQRERWEKLQNEINSLLSELSKRKALRERDSIENETILLNYGTVSALDGLIASLEIERAALETVISGLRENFDGKVRIPRERSRKTVERIDRLKEQIHSIELEISRLKATIENELSRRGYTAKADIEIELDIARRRESVLNLRAEAARLLKEVVDIYERNRTEALSAPIRSKLDPWLSFLTGGNYNRLQLDQELKPSSVYVPLYDSPLPVSSLSHGMHEQVIVLLRLAIGVVSSADERNLIVIDDRLVNADPVRMKRFCEILEDAARNCQIIIATCNDMPYSSLATNVIHVPSDGC